MDLSTNCSVALRVRPHSTKEMIESRGVYCTECNAEENCIDIPQIEKKFQFDKVMGPESSQAEVYESSVQSLVDSYFEGYNATILAYGQTGSGKTYTMGSACYLRRNSEDNGIIPRVITKIFEICEEIQKKKVTMELSCSFLEIYNEEIRDLLDVDSFEDNPRNDVMSSSKYTANLKENSKLIRITEDPVSKQIVLIGLKNRVVKSLHEMFDCLDIGSARRSTGSTTMNSMSSRSHAIFTITMLQGNDLSTQPNVEEAPSKQLGEEREDGVCAEHHADSSPPFSNKENASHSSNKDSQAYGKATDRGKEEGSAAVCVDSSGKAKNLQERFDGVSKFTVSKFHFVDLAGSERAKKTHASGGRLKEGIHINAGLLALGNVIFALTDEKAGGGGAANIHIPYRDSKLTRILQDSLGGNSKTLMIACVSGSPSNFAETYNTIKYASRARRIKNTPMINRDPAAIMVENLRQQVHDLSRQLMMFKREEISERNREEETLDFSLLKGPMGLTIAQLEDLVKTLQEKEKTLSEEVEKQSVTLLTLSAKISVLSGILNEKGIDVSNEDCEKMVKETLDSLKEKEITALRSKVDEDEKIISALRENEKNQKDSILLIVREKQSLELQNAELSRFLNNLPFGVVGKTKTRERGRNAHLQEGTRRSGRLKSEVSKVQRSLGGVPEVEEPSTSVGGASASSNIGMMSKVKLEGQEDVDPGENTKNEAPKQLEGSRDDQDSSLLGLLEDCNEVIAEQTKLQDYHARLEIDIGCNESLLAAAVSENVEWNAMHNEMIEKVDYWKNLLKVVESERDALAQVLEVTSSSEVVDRKKTEKMLREKNRKMEEMQKDIVRLQNEKEIIFRKKLDSESEKGRLQCDLAKMKDNLANASKRLQQQEKLHKDAELKREKVIVELKRQEQRAAKEAERRHDMQKKENNSLKKQNEELTRKMKVLAKASRQPLPPQSKRCLEKVSPEGFRKLQKGALLSKKNAGNLWNTRKEKRKLCCEEEAPDVGEKEAAPYDAATFRKVLLDLVGSRVAIYDNSQQLQKDRMAEAVLWEKIKDLRNQLHVMDQQLLGNEDQQQSEILSRNIADIKDQLDTSEQEHLLLQNIIRQLRESLVSADECSLKGIKSMLTREVDIATEVILSEFEELKYKEKASLYTISELEKSVEDLQRFLNESNLQKETIERNMRKNTHKLFLEFSEAKLSLIDFFLHHERLMSKPSGSSKMKMLNFLRSISSLRRGGRGDTRYVPRGKLSRAAEAWKPISRVCSSTSTTGFASSSFDTTDTEEGPSPSLRGERTEGDNPGDAHTGEHTKGEIYTEGQQKLVRVVRKPAQYSASRLLTNVIMERQSYPSLTGSTRRNRSFSAYESMLDEKADEDVLYVSPFVSEEEGALHSSPLDSSYLDVWDACSDEEGTRPGDVYEYDHPQNEARVCTPNEVQSNPPPPLQSNVCASADPLLSDAIPTAHDWVLPDEMLSDAIEDMLKTRKFAEEEEKEEKEKSCFLRGVAEEGGVVASSAKAKLMKPLQNRKRKRNFSQDLQLVSAHVLEEQREDNALEACANAPVDGVGLLKSSSPFRSTSSGQSELHTKRRQPELPSYLEADKAAASNSQKRMNGGCILKKEGRINREDLLEKLYEEADGCSAAYSGYLSLHTPEDTQKDEAFNTSEAWKGGKFSLQSTPKASENSVNRLKWRFSSQPVSFRCVQDQPVKHRLCSIEKSLTREGGAPDCSSDACELYVEDAERCHNELKGGMPGMKGSEVFGGAQEGGTHTAQGARVTQGRSSTGTAAQGTHTAKAKHSEKATHTNTNTNAHTNTHINEVLSGDFGLIKGKKRSLSAPYLLELVGDASSEAEKESSFSIALPLEASLQAHTVIDSSEANPDSSVCAYVPAKAIASNLRTVSALTNTKDAGFVLETGEKSSLVGQTNPAPGKAACDASVRSEVVCEIEESARDSVREDVSALLLHGTSLPVEVNSRDAGFSGSSSATLRMESSGKKDEAGGKEGNTPGSSLDALHSPLKGMRKQSLNRSDKGWNGSEALEVSEKLEDSSDEHTSIAISVVGTPPYPTGNPPNTQFISVLAAIPDDEAGVVDDNITTRSDGCSDDACVWKNGAKAGLLEAFLEPSSTAESSFIRDSGGSLASLTPPPEASDAEPSTGFAHTTSGSSTLKRSFLKAKNQVAEGSSERSFSCLEESLELPGTKLSNVKIVDLQKGKFNALKWENENLKKQLIVASKKNEETEENERKLRKILEEKQETIEKLKCLLVSSSAIDASKVNEGLRSERISDSSYGSSMIPPSLSPPHPLNEGSNSPPSLLPRDAEVTPSSTSLKPFHTPFYCSHKVPLAHQFYITAACFDTLPSNAEMEDCGVCASSGSNGGNSIPSSSSSPTKLFTCSYNSIKMWNLEDMRESVWEFSSTRSTRTNQLAEIKCVRSLNEGRMLVTAAGHYLKLFDIRENPRNYQNWHVTDSHGGCHSVVLLSSNSRHSGPVYVAAAGFDTFLKIFDLRKQGNHNHCFKVPTGQVIESLGRLPMMPSDGLCDTVQTPAMKGLIASCCDRQIRLWTNGWSILHPPCNDVVSNFEFLRFEDIPLSSTDEDNILQNKKIRQKLKNSVIFVSSSLDRCFRGWHIAASLLDGRTNRGAGAATEAELTSSKKLEAVKPPFIGSFYTAGDIVTSFARWRRSNLIISGDTEGYIKFWYSNFSSKRKLFRPSYSSERSDGDADDFIQQISLEFTLGRSCLKHSDARINQILPCREFFVSISNDRSFKLFRPSKSPL